MFDEVKGVARRDVKPFAPGLENGIVIGKKSFQEGAQIRVGVISFFKRKRERQREACVGFRPRCMVVQSKGVARTVIFEVSNMGLLEENLERFGHSFTTS